MNRTHLLSFFLKVSFIKFTQKFAKLQPYFEIKLNEVWFNVCLWQIIRFILRTSHEVIFIGFILVLVFMYIKRGIGIVAKDLREMKSFRTME